MLIYLKSVVSCFVNISFFYPFHIFTDMEDINYMPFVFWKRRWFSKLTLEDCGELWQCESDNETKYSY